MGWSDEWVSLDTETTGFGQDARIIEIGVTRFVEGQPIFQWSSLIFAAGVNWEDKRVQEALAVNGIDPQELVGQPMFVQVYPKLLEVMKGRVWVAHNADFDMRMLVQECNHIGKTALLQLPDLAFCTKCLAYQLEPELPNHKLDTVAARWGVKQNGAHRALADATTCGQVLSEMYGEFRLPDDDHHMVNLHRGAQRNWLRRRKGTAYEPPP